MKDFIINNSDDLEKLKSVDTKDIKIIVNAKDFVLTKNCLSNKFIGDSNFDNVKEVEQIAFYSSTFLSDIILNNVEKISKDAFANTYFSYGIDLGNKLKYIGTSAFGKSNIKVIKLPESIDRIYDSAFEECDELIVVELPNKKISIPYKCFFECNDLNSVNLSQVISVGVQAFKWTSIETADLTSCLHLGEGAFSNCEELKTVYLGKGIQRIPDNCFKETGLISVDFNADLDIIEVNAFSNCIGLDIEKLSCVKILDGAFYGCGITNIKLLNTTYIGRSAFKYNFELEKIEFPDSLEEIDEEAFVGCKNLKEVYIPKNVKKVDPSAFGHDTQIFFKGSQNELKKVVGLSDMENVICCDDIDKLIDRFSFRQINKIAKNKEKSNEDNIRK